jgi:hypothetical protein
MRMLPAIAAVAVFATAISASSESALAQYSRHAGYGGPSGAAVNTQTVPYNGNVGHGQPVVAAPVFIPGAIVGAIAGVAYVQAGYPVPPVCRFARRPVFDADGNVVGVRRVRACRSPYGRN